MTLEEIRKIVKEEEGKKKARRKIVKKLNKGKKYEKKSYEGELGALADRRVVGRKKRTIKDEHERQWVAGDEVKAGDEVVKNEVHLVEEGAGRYLGSVDLARTKLTKAMITRLLKEKETTREKPSEEKSKSLRKEQKIQAKIDEQAKEVIRWKMIESRKDPEYWEFGNGKRKTTKQIWKAMLRYDDEFSSRGSFGNKGRGATMNSNDLEELKKALGQE